EEPEPRDRRAGGMGVGDVNTEAARGYGRAAREEAGGGDRSRPCHRRSCRRRRSSGVHDPVAAAALTCRAIGGRVQALRAAARAPPDRLALGRAIGRAENPCGAIRCALVAALAEIAHAVAAPCEVTPYAIRVALPAHLAIASKRFARFFWTPATHLSA